MPLLTDLYLFRFFIFWYVCGVILLSFDLVPPWLEWANVVFLVTAGVLAMLYFYRSLPGIRSISVITAVFILSMLIESAGVHTGLFFGDYSYETDFGPKLLGVPVTIGFAWIMVMGTSHVLAAPLTELTRFGKPIFYAGYGALAATALDLIIDPVAFDVKEYWIWHEGGYYYDIPFSNFYGWFILSFILHLIIYAAFYRKDSGWMNKHSSFWTGKMVWLYGMMAGMFIIVALTNGLLLAPFLSATTVILFTCIYLKLSGRKIKNDKS